jgi:hypothetical protein
MSSERSALTPYNFMSNNPVMRVDPTGMLDGWYENEDNEIVYDEDINSQEDLDAAGVEGTYKGENGVGYNPETGNQVHYFEDGSSFEAPEMLATAEVNGGKMSDHARVIKAGKELGIYAGHDKFIDGAIGISGELTEKTGTGVSWIGIVTLQPELVLAGQGISRVGTGIKIVGDLRNGNRGAAIERAAIEAVTGGLGTGIKSASGSVLEKSILEGSLEAKKTIYQELISPN